MAASTHARGRATAAFQPMGHAIGGNVICQTAHYSTTAAASANDVIQMIKVPKGAVIVDGWITMDSSGAFTFSVGDGSSVARFQASASVSGAATQQIFLKSKLGHEYTADDTIDVKLTGIAGSIAAHNISLTVYYLVDGQAGWSIV